MTTTPSVADTLFIRACRRQTVERTPVWFMRQAGRYMPEYRALRAKHSLIELCTHPELAAEVTLQPLRRLEVDAAIIFADLLLPPMAMGMSLKFVEGEGPVLGAPIRSEAALHQLHDPADGELNYVGEAIRMVCRELNGRLPVIGFCGAPFTVASYMIEGGATRDFLTTKRLIYAQPALWRALLDRLVRVQIAFLRSQVEAGAAALQIFDSWIGALSPADYIEYALPHTRQLISAASSLGVPVIHFGTGTSGMLELLREAGGDVIGADWRIDLGEAWRRIGHDRAVQGNLDPVLLYAPQPVLRTAVERIMRAANQRPGHIFNLGHGILPTTPVENVQAVVEWVREFSANTTHW
ncbi:MAG: uroporphyrinogen decarboxylase [Acidobacteria bacterium]|nr:uroporphyrinogen decarboxylase [Acidobacteriota bacterium]